uniref:NADH-ubiquinone oxidoreductase chain 3 n=1 Tax=Rhagophthalmus giganteus TaxID=2591746 RepID=A0A5C0PWU8_9COLE|nr:NADH dehydrogenase subunit 3 [Rhagophthalmus giganteus]
MMLLSVISLTIITLTSALMLLASTISKKTFYDREKSSPFECGFDPKSSARIPFSLQFFLIALIFLIFDVEITLILPLTITIKLVNMTKFIIIMITFMAILLMGLFHEWKQGALNWMY